MKKLSSAAGLTRRVLSAVQRPQGNVSVLPPIAEAMATMLADVERGHPVAAVGASDSQTAGRPSTPSQPAFVQA